MFYNNELLAIKKSNRFRQRKIFDKNLVDLASNDYLGLSSNKKLLKKAYKLVKKEKFNATKSSILVNGYSSVHKKFEDALCKKNLFEKGIILGSGFLANISLIESLVRKGDILFMDEDYHASGILASRLVENQVILFKHNDAKDLEEKINTIKAKRIIIAIEGVYSMQGDIAPKSINIIALKYNAILIVDEAHSSGVIGKDLCGWYDYHKIKIRKNHIKMGTLGKAYASYGAYILASSHIIEFLENRAKAIIYTTALSLFDTALAYVSFLYIQKNKKSLKLAIKKHQKLIKTTLGITIKTLILPIEINDNKKVLLLQEELIQSGFLVGAIRQPTVKKAILRVILKLDITSNELINFLQKYNILIP
jgi:8-amino-7-oxononanoate synthase